MTKPPVDDTWVDNPLTEIPLAEEEQHAWGRVEGWIGRGEFAHAPAPASTGTPRLARVALAIGIVVLLASFAVFNFARLGSRTPLPAASPTVRTSASPAPSASPSAAPSPTSRVATPGPFNPPPSGSWQPAPSMSVARVDFTATLLKDGRILVAGGVSDVTVAGSATSSVEIYDPATGKFTPAPPMSIGRAGQTATLLSDGRVLVVGGYTQLGSAPLGTAEIYDPSSNLWSAAASLHFGRSNHAAVLIVGGKVMVVGGAAPQIGIGPHGPGAATIPPEIYDPAHDTWKSAAMPTWDRPVDPTATLLSNGHVLVVGGQYMWNSPDESMERSEVYDPSSNSWSAVTPDARFAARQYQTATLLKNGMVLVAGGMFDLQPVTTAALYDPSGNSWIELPNMNAARCGQAAQLLSSGRVLLTGSGCWGKETSEVDEFDPTANRFYSVAALPAPGGRMQAGMLPDLTVIVMGGTENASATSASYVFRP